ncbi:MAG: nucleotidyltransferase domain-containing protein [Bacteroidetes bacterium]|jgi:predicted nucleotidyltransferase|nr:nucleotidyltransferase domain-containing protein [Bacteroidota bacterium]MBT7493424.1 nucleotidyltransferase domain-containing protein [Bacteroidota bacterium]
MNNDYGISQLSFQLILDAFKQFQEIEKVILFGSRAMGNYKTGSDIDLAIYGKLVNLKTTTKLSDLLNKELPIPYYIDIIQHSQISLESFREHIGSKGKIIYSQRNITA